MYKILKPNEIDINKIHFSDIKTSCYGHNISYINHDNEILTMVTKRLRTPFGCKYWSNSNRISFNFSLDENNNILREILEKIDKKLRNWITENPEFKNLLNGNKFRNGINDMFELCQSTIVKKNDIGDPLLKINIQPDKIPILYDKDKNEIKIIDSQIEIPKLIPKNTQCKMLLHFSHIWFKDNKFGILIKIKQVMICPSDNFSDFSNFFSKCCHLEYDSDSDN